MDWAEEDSIRYETEEKERKRNIVLKKFKEAQKKYDEAERNYQDTGSASTMRTMYRHEDMMMICELALQALDNVCEKCESHRRKARYAVDKYKTAKKLGDNYVLNFDYIIADFIDLLY